MICLYIFFYLTVLAFWLSVCIYLNNFKKQSCKCKLNDHVYKSKRSHTLPNDHIYYFSDRLSNLNDRLNTLNVSFNSPKYMLNDHINITN